ncbi:hypothetical protein SUGI_0190910 [Cryptomeria japonica]|nr:hypothetical protein SUGI_0190910 [Cryptomeria japonica]
MGSKLGYGNWSSVAFRHPSTFKTLALDPSLKHKIKHDLDCFLQSREFYRKTGRAWKRGYLLYGPPGTGKSSLIAAIANYMNYDVYDLEITRVLDNPNLRQLLLATSSKSVIVIEDIDCAAKLHTTAMSRYSQCPGVPLNLTRTSPKALDKLRLPSLFLVCLILQMGSGPAVAKRGL